LKASAANGWSTDGSRTTSCSDYGSTPIIGGTSSGLGR
jgi:hypothetical protein